MGVISCSVNGAFYKFTDVGVSATPGNGLAFQAGTTPSIGVTVGGPAAVGSVSDGHAFNGLYFQGPDGNSYYDAHTFSASTCLITLTHLPSGPGDKWTGTFSGKLVAIDGTTTVAVTDGLIDLTAQ
jgi:hypothetical protein